MDRKRRTLKVFREYGWDLTDPDAEDLGRRVSRSPIRGWLVAILEKCVILPDFALGDRAWNGKVLAALAAADPDPVRTHLRTALAFGGSSQSAPFRACGFFSFHQGLAGTFVAKAAAKAIGHPGYRQDGPAVLYDGLTVYILYRGTLSQPRGYVFHEVCIFHK